jgi:hypothetical protein
MDGPLRTCILVLQRQSTDDSLVCTLPHVRAWLLRLARLLDPVSLRASIAYLLKAVSVLVYTNQSLICTANWKSAVSADYQRSIV